MKLGIMQPYFFPYLGYFALMKYTDHLVIFDTPQYIRKGFINRNRILDGKGTSCYITVPVVGEVRETSIKDIKISKTMDWFVKITGQLTVYKKRAPYYEHVLQILNDINNKQFQYISELNTYSLEITCKYIGIPYDYDVFSQMNLTINEVHSADEWALHITKALGYDTYVNPPGGLAFFDPIKYQKNQINLEFLQINLNPYSQKNIKFVEALSILDAMMFLKPTEILTLLDDYVIIKK